MEAGKDINVKQKKEWIKRSNSNRRGENIKKRHGKERMYIYVCFPHKVISEPELTS